MAVHLRTAVRGRFLMIPQGQHARSSTRLLVFHTSLSPEQWLSERAPRSSAISTTWNLLEM